MTQIRIDEDGKWYFFLNFLDFSDFLSANGVSRRLSDPDLAHGFDFDI